MTKFKVGDLLICPHKGKINRKIEKIHLQIDKIKLSYLEKDGTFRMTSRLLSLKWAEKRFVHIREDIIKIMFDLE